MILYINRTKFPSVFTQKNLACGAFSLTSFACGAVLHKKILPTVLFFTYKKLACGAFDFSVFFTSPSHWY